MRPKRSMTQVYLASMLLLTTIPIVAIGYFWASQRYQQFEEQVELHRQSYLATHKQFLRDQVEEILAYINYQKGLAKQRSRKSLKNHTEEAYNLIATLYAGRRSAGGRVDTDRLLQQVVELLRPMRFNDGRGWYVLLDGEGRVLLNSASRPGENRDVLDFRSVGGRDVIREAIERARRDGEGFLDVTATTVKGAGKGAGNSGQFSSQLAYVKYFKPLNLVVLSGEYLEDVERAVQRDVVTMISHTKYYPERSVPFIIDAHGILLAQPARPDLVGKNISHLVEATTGQPLSQLYRESASKAGDNFVEYQGKRINSAEPVQGVSFTQAYTPWKWIIGAGFYLDQLEAHIAKDRESMRSALARDMGYVALGLAVSLIVVAGIASWFARRSASGFSQFNRFFSEASHRSTTIETARLPYTEFSELADDANWMIFERTRYERALKKSEQRVTLALKYSRHYLWDVHLRSGALVVSSGFFESLGYGRNDLAFDRFETVVKLCHPDDIPLLKSEWRLRRIYKTGIEFRLKDQSGRYRWFFGRGSRVEREPGYDSNQRMLGIVTEITQRKQIEQELIAARISAEEANYAKSQFLATVSHELRTPLNGVMGYTQLLMKDHALSGERRQYLQSIMNCGKHLLDMIAELLQLSQMESGSGNVDPQEYGLAAIVKEVSDIGASKAQAKNLEYRVCVGTGVPEKIFVDTTKLKQILLIMISNAIKFTRKGWIKLTVDCDKSQRMLTFKVSDSGVGISKEHLKSIFEPFRQLQGANTDGSGLGLALSHRLAVSLRGELKVTSELGEGSEFELSLPLAALSVDSSSPYHMRTMADPLIISAPMASSSPVPHRPKISIDSAVKLHHALEMGDVEKLELLVQTLLEGSNNAELCSWLQRLLDMLKHFDMESAQRMIEEVAGPEAVA